MGSTEPAGQRYFHEVALSGSIARASANLFVAPSAVSRQIRLLEDELGVQLFTRDPRGMTLTAAGHRVLAYAVETQQRAADLRFELSADRHSLPGHVVIATVEGLLTRRIPDAIEALAAAHPNIRIDVHTAGSHHVEAAIAEGAAQLGFIFGPPTRSDLTALKTRPLPLLVMVRPDNPLARKQSCSLRDLDGHPVALPTPDFGIRQELDRACVETSTRLKIHYETNSLALLREIATRTGAATFMPAEDAATDLTQGTLVGIPLTDRRLTNTHITLAKGLQAYTSSAAKTVSDALFTAIDE